MDDSSALEPVVLNLDLQLTARILRAGARGRSILSAKSGAGGVRYAHVLVCVLVYGQSIFGFVLAFLRELNVLAHLKHAQSFFLVAACRMKKDVEGNLMPVKPNFLMNRQQEQSGRCA